MPLGKTTTETARPRSSRFESVELSIADRSPKTCPDCGELKPAVQFNVLARDYGSGMLRLALDKSQEGYPGEALTPDGMAGNCDACYAVYLRDYPGNANRLYAMWEVEITAKLEAERERIG